LTVRVRTTSASSLRTSHLSGVQADGVEQLDDDGLEDGQGVDLEEEPADVFLVGGLEGLGDHRELAGEHGAGVAVDLDDLHGGNEGGDGGWQALAVDVEDGGDLAAEVDER